MHAHAAIEMGGAEDGAVWMSAIDLSGYEVTDAFFGRPFIDIDEERDRPSPHRFIQGGFAGTDTEFAFYFPPARALHGPDVPAARGRQRGARRDVRRRHPRRDVPAHRHERPARRLHGRVEPGPHRRRLRPEGRARTRRCTATGPAPSPPGCPSTSPPRSTAAPRITATCGAAAAAAGGRRSAWRTRRASGTAACRRRAAARSPSPATPSGSRPGPSCRSARCSTSSACSAATRSSRWPTGWRPAAAATRSTG